MILFDFSPIVIGSVHAAKKDIETANGDIGLIRHLVLNTIRSLTAKYKREYGETVIATDTGSSWRKQQFPQYKANRAKNREKSSLDWNLIFIALDQIKDELIHFYPGKVISIPTIEADDIIGRLTQNAKEPVVIISPDSDMRQLLNSSVMQYSPLLKKEYNMTIKEASDEFLTKLIKGDPGDGVPNIRSDDNVFVENGRQTPIRSKDIDEIIQSGNIPAAIERKFGTTAVRNYYRNRSLISLTDLPESITDKIDSAYQSATSGNRHAFMNYLIEKNLGALTTALEEF